MARPRALGNLVTNFLDASGVRYNLADLALPEPARTAAFSQSRAMFELKPDGVLEIDSDVHETLAKDPAENGPDAEFSTSPMPTSIRSRIRSRRSLATRRARSPRRS